MRVMFSCVPAAGHFFPLVPLAWALRSAGHDVIFGVPKDYCTEVASAGLPALATSDSFDLRSLVIDMACMPYSSTPSQADHEIAARASRSSVLLAERNAVGTRALIQQWKPQLVVTDPLWLVGRLAAADAGVPLVEHRWGLAPPAYFTDGPGSLLDRLRSRLGFGDVTPPALTVDVCPPSFQLPDTRRGRDMTYIPYNGRESLSAWHSVLGEGPLLCVTFGSLLPYIRDLSQLVDSVLQAAAELGLDVVLAAPNTHAKKWVNDSSRVRAAGWLPIRLLLEQCEAVVHHGGSGTMMTAMRHGLPQVITPHLADQFLNASRLTDFGAGVVPVDHSPDELAAAINAAASDSRHRAAASALAHEIAAQPSPAETVTVLRDLALTK